MLHQLNDFLIHIHILNHGNESPLTETDKILMIYATKNCSKDVTHFMASIYPWQTDFTYINQYQYFCIDHIAVSLCIKDQIKSVDIVKEATNPSNHRPIKLNSCC